MRVCLRDVGVEDWRQEAAGCGPERLVTLDVKQLHTSIPMEEKSEKNN